MTIFSNFKPNLFLLLMLLSSCSPVAQDLATAQSNPTSTPTLAVINTSTPSLSPTTTQSLIDKIFILPTRPPYAGTTPTPIATSALGSSSMRLKDLSEAGFINLITDLQIRSYQNFPPHDDWWSEGQFVSSQESVALAIQEYLYHFPDSLDAERLRWQLAFIDSIMFEDLRGNEYYDEWMVEQLQSQLNQNGVLPNNLESVLDKYWFEVDYFQSIENLFGDGKIAWFYVISPQVWAEDEDYQKSPDYFRRGGLFIAVREINQGEFQIHLLENAWSFSSGSGSLFEISDFNKNDIPEIALNIWLHSGSMCGGGFKIFEWSDTAFADLTRENIQIGDCVDSYEYFLVDGEPAIRFKKFFTPVPSVYIWNGSYYEFSKYEYTNLVEQWVAATLNPQESFSEEAQAVEAILSSENMEGLSSAQGDFLRFRLGLAYALTSEVSQAKKVLQDLADNPLDTTRIVYSDFAKNFLRYYSGDENLYLACKKSREILDKALTPSSAQDEAELLGISFDFHSGFGPGMLRCFDRDVFKLLIDKLPVAVENVPDELRKNGVKLYYAEKRDVNLDGFLEEWLIVIDDGMFVVFPNQLHYEVVELDYFWYGEDTSKYSDTTIAIEKWNGIQGSVLIILAGQDMVIKNIGEDYSSIWLNSEYDVEDVIFSPRVAPAQFQVSYNKPASKDAYYDVPWKGYRWDAARRAFRDDLIEYSLFVENNPDKAVEIAELLVPLLLDWKGLDLAAG